MVSLSINRGVPLLMGDRTKQPAKAFVDLLGQIRTRLDEEELDELEDEVRISSRQGLVRS